MPLASKLKPLCKAEQGFQGKKHLLSTYQADIKHHTLIEYTIKKGHNWGMVIFSLALLCLAAATVLVVALSVIDLRVRLLPDKLVLPFGLLAVIFHSITTFHFLTLPDMAAGAAFGGGILYGIRFVANRLYQQDTLGLGDVKLMLAAGLWLGPDGILMAMTLGAAFGLLHGLAVATGQSLFKKAPFSLSRLEVPAGQGFAVGIFLGGLSKFAGIATVMGGMSQ